jgi:hypothetical protein
MADVIVQVTDPAASTDLITLDELKINLGLPSGTPSASDAQLIQAISYNSDLLSVLCNRVFARETVKETWRWDGCECLANPRIYLTHFPVDAADIQSVTTGGSLVDSTDYELESQTGKLRYLLGGWLDPTVIVYTGGYILPDDAPLPLKQAASILTRIAYFASKFAGVAMGGVRQLSHKHSRVSFFDPAQQVMMASGGPGVSQAVNSLISHYTRYNI